jgi:hypothetical protein
MKAQHLIAAAIVAITAQHAAFAQDTNAPKTRAEVRAELESARADGSLETRNNYHGVAASLPFASSKSREQVKADLAAARADGSLEVTRNYHGVSTELAFAPTKSRAEVRAEVLAAIAAGEQFSRGDNNEV